MLKGWLDRSTRAVSARHAIRAESVGKYLARYSFDGTGWDRTGQFRPNALLTSECGILFCNQEVQTFRSENQLVVLLVDTVRSDRIIRTVPQVNVARLEGLMEKRSGNSGINGRATRGWLTHKRNRPGRRCGKSDSESKKAR